MNSNKNFQNFKIQHDKKQINEGVDYVFTLQDKNVLENSDGELDVLENQILRDSFKTQKKKENTFDPEVKKNILSKYDEVKEDGFTLKIDEDEKVVDEQEDNLEAEEETSGELNRIKEKFRLLKKHKPEVNNNYINFLKLPNNKKEIELKYEKKFTTDYMTHEEFKSVKTVFKKKKMPLKKGIHSVHTEESEQNDISDSNKINAMNKPATQVYDEYDELNLFLEKQRNQANKSKKIEPELVISQALKSEEERNNINKEKLPEQPSEPENKNNMMEFISETTEFLKKIPSKSEIEENYKLITAPTPFSLKDSKSGTQSVVNIPLPSERLKFGASSLINPNEKFLNKKRENKAKLVTEGDETKSQISQSENFDKDDKVEELQEPLVGKGIATALKVLRSRGVVGKMELKGRSKDSEYTSNEVFLPKEELEKFKSNKVEIEYRDNKGRLLTPKEMFRQQCYIFHGSGPGRKKLEKRLVKEELQEKMKNQDPSESKTFKYLKTFQKKTNSAYLVLQGKGTSLP